MTLPRPTGLLYSGSMPTLPRLSRRIFLAAAGAAPLALAASRAHA
jgi:hypothetical protein